MNNVLSVEFLQQASDVIKVLGHPQRLKIIEYLEKGEKSVSQIQEHLSSLSPLHLSIYATCTVVASSSTGGKVLPTFIPSLLNLFIKFWTVFPNASKKLNRANGN